MGLAFAGMLMASCADSPTAVADYQVVPMPLEITAASQGSFLLKSGETIYYTAGNEKMKKNAEFLAAFIKEQTGIALKVAEGDGEEGIGCRMTRRVRDGRHRVWGVYGVRGEACRWDDSVYSSTTACMYSGVRPILSDKSCQCGLLRSMSAIFQSRRHRLSCFSRAMAWGKSSNVSK